MTDEALVQKGVAAARTDSDRRDHETPKWRVVVSRLALAALGLYVVASIMLTAYTLTEIKKTQACTRSQTQAARAVAEDDRKVIDNAFGRITDPSLTPAEITEIRNQYFADRRANEQVRAQLQLTSSGVCQ